MRAARGDAAAAEAKATELKAKVQRQRGVLEAARGGGGDVGAYARNVVLKFISLPDGGQRDAMLPVLAALFSLSAADIAKATAARAAHDDAAGGWAAWFGGGGAAAAARADDADDAARARDGAAAAGGRRRRRRRVGGRGARCGRRWRARGLLHHAHNELQRRGWRQEP